MPRDYSWISSIDWSQFYCIFLDGQVSVLKLYEWKTVTFVSILCKRTAFIQHKLASTGLKTLLVGKIKMSLNSLYETVYLDFFLYAVNMHICFFIIIYHH